MHASYDIRTQVTDKIIARRGGRVTGYIPVTYAQLSRELKLSRNTVKNIWGRYYGEDQLSANMAKNHGHSLFHSRTNLYITLKHGSNSNSGLYNAMLQIAKSEKMVNHLPHSSVEAFSVILTTFRLISIQLFLYFSEVNFYYTLY